MTERKKYSTHGMTGKVNNPKGRPKGSQNKVSAQSVLAAIEARVGIPFEQALADGYYDVIQTQDRGLRQKYEHMLLSRLVAEKTELDVTTLGNSLNERKSAFEQLINKLKTRGDSDDAVNQEQE